MTRLPYIAAAFVALFPIGDKLMPTVAAEASPPTVSASVQNSALPVSNDNAVYRALSPEKQREVARAT